MAGGLLDRIARESGVVGLLDALAERLAPTDLQSLLVEVYRRRAAGQTPADLLGKYARNRFNQRAAVDPRALAEVDRLAYSLASPPFDPLELSPVCPLGTSSVVAGISQNLAGATIRNTGVVSAPPNVRALECARRRGAGLRPGARPGDRVKPCPSHRLPRPQTYSGPASF